MSHEYFPGFLIHGSRSVLKEARFGFRLTVIGEECFGFGLVWSFGVEGHVGIEVLSIFLPVLLFFQSPESLGNVDDL